MSHIVIDMCLSECMDIGVFVKHWRSAIILKKCIIWIE